MSDLTDPENRFTTHTMDTSSDNHDDNIEKTFQPSDLQGNVQNIHI